MMRYLLQMIIFDYALRLHNDSDIKIIPRGKGFGSKNAHGEAENPSMYLSLQLNLIRINLVSIFQNIC